MSERRIRMLLAKKKIDVHGRGTKLIARELRDAGIEVITFRFGTPEEIARVAVQEDVDLIGVSIMTSGHIQVAERLVPLLREQGQGRVPVIMGGVIPRVDFPRLKEAGVDEVFPPGIPGEVVAAYVKARVGSREAVPEA